MMTFDEVLAAVRPLEAEELRLWIAQRWVLPERRDGEYRFGNVDLARIRMIHDFRYTLNVAPDTLPVVLSLLDQLYATRSRMRAVIDAINALPPETRQTILENLETAGITKPTC